MTNAELQVRQGGLDVAASTSAKKKHLLSSLTPSDVLPPSSAH